MYISEISLTNFRNFQSETVLFNPGVNVIIGHNNSGKTNLLRALQFIFDRTGNNKPSIDDFSKNISDFSSPPSIQISVLICPHKDEPDDQNVIYDWLVENPPNYRAKLTYIFELPVKHHEEYLDLIEGGKKDDGQYDAQACFQIINKKFLSKYVSRIYGGNPAKKEKASNENLDRFDYQFLTAIRDAEREMFFGNNTILRDVLNYFLDYDITQGQEMEELSDEQLEEIKQREDDFKEKSKILLEELIGRIDKNEILKYSKDTGADKGGVPNFDADASEHDLLFALRLVVEKSGLKIPINNNGLGYNNLLYMALILAKMQMEVSSAFMGDNAKVFPILAIEEPEAHLHPNLQAKFLKFLETNLETNQQARQAFVTTHSTHITSAIELNSIICLYTDIEEEYRVGYPGKVFSENNEGKSSKIFVQRFLDATKSNMLFAEKVIFVEGISEKILIPCFAAYLEKEDKLTDNHTAIISVDSRSFKHFLKIFSFNDDLPYAINKKIVCITDADPTIKKGNNWVSAYPFTLESLADEETKAISFHIDDLKTDYSENYENINLFHPEEGKGKTLEYELAIINPKSELLITTSFPSQNSAHTPENFSELQSILDQETDNIIDKYKEMRGIDDINKDKILSGIDNCTWDENEKNKAFIAAIYNRIVKSAKGEHAFYLEKNLRENLDKDDGQLDFIIPDYIEGAINEIAD
ncbi:AAA family ATPase [Gracilimonas sp.]|uniref:ATP-dependent nuclease n=1 Tax=Gracilimonas sp. TaxID=1974203 RepID=UPI0032ED3E02